MFPWEIVQAVTLVKLLRKLFPEAHINYLGYGFDEFCFARIKDELEYDKRLFLGFDSVFVVRNDTALCELASLKNPSLQDLRKIKSIAFTCGDTVEVNGPVEEGRIDFTVFPDYSDLSLEKYFSPTPVFVDKMSNKCFWSSCVYCSINTYKGELSRKWK